MRAASLLVLGCFGCISIAPSVATPTALEHQLLGVYEELDQRLIYASSVRGDVARPPGSLEARTALAIEARALQQFNEDDVRELKSAKCIAETQHASLVARPCTMSSAFDQRRITRVVEEENRARAAIVSWAAYLDAKARSLSRSEEGNMRDTYARLLREAAKPGDLYEVRAGTFEEIRE